MLEGQGRREDNILNPGYAVLIGVVYSSELDCGILWWILGVWRWFVAICGGLQWLAVVCGD